MQLHWLRVLERKMIPMCVGKNESVGDRGAYNISRSAGEKHEILSNNEERTLGNGIDCHLAAVVIFDKFGKLAT